MFRQERLEQDVEFQQWSKYAIVHNKSKNVTTCQDE